MSVEALNTKFVKVSSGADRFVDPELVEKLSKIKTGKINFVPFKPINPITTKLKVKHPYLLMLSLGTLLSCGAGKLVLNKLEKSDQVNEYKFNNKLE